MNAPTDAEAWLIVKRDLYFRPDCCGYTGIRDEAGRYTHDFAKGYEGEGVSIVRLADAPEFREAAFHDLVIKHIIRQRKDARAAAPADDWRDDPGADERWNAGLDFAMVRFCQYLGVDPGSVSWDAATETLDGDVSAVIGNILRAKFGEDWAP